jgi:hypothetical protein
LVGLTALYLASFRTDPSLDRGAGSGTASDPVADPEAVTY